MEALAADPSLSRPSAAFALGLAKSYRAAAKLRQAGGLGGEPKDAVGLVSCKRTRRKKGRGQQQNLDRHAARMLGLGSSQPKARGNQATAGHQQKNPQANTAPNFLSSLAPPETAERALLVGCPPAPPDLKHFGLSDADLKKLPRLWLGSGTGTEPTYWFFVISIILFVLTFGEKIQSIAGWIFGYFLFAAVSFIPIALLFSVTMLSNVNFAL